MVLTEHIKYVSIIIVAVFVIVLLWLRLKDYGKRALPKETKQAEKMRIVIAEYNE